MSQSCTSSSAAAVPFGSVAAILDSLRDSVEMGGRPVAACHQSDGARASDRRRSALTCTRLPPCGEMQAAIARAGATSRPHAWAPEFGRLDQSGSGVLMTSSVEKPNDFSRRSLPERKLSKVDSDRQFGRFWAIPGSPSELWRTPRRDADAPVPRTSPRGHGLVRARGPAGTRWVAPAPARGARARWGDRGGAGCARSRPASRSWRRSGDGRRTRGDTRASRSRGRGA